MNTVIFKKYGRYNHIIIFFSVVFYGGPDNIIFQRIDDG
jgi:hypothetical protein